MNRQMIERWPRCHCPAATVSSAASGDSYLVRVVWQAQSIEVAVVFTASKGHWKAPVYRDTKELAGGRRASFTFC